MRSTALGGAGASCFTEKSIGLRGKIAYLPTMNSLSNESRVKLTPDQVSSELGAEVVILHVRNGMYYGLDEVGVVIWKKLREGARVADIVTSVVQQFDVGAQQCEQDVLRILGEMIDAQLVTVEPS